MDSICQVCQGQRRFESSATACPFQWRAQSRKQFAIEESRICGCASVAVAGHSQDSRARKRPQPPAGSASSAHAGKLSDELARKARQSEIQQQMSLWPLTARIVCIAMLNLDSCRGQVLFLSNHIEPDGDEAGAVAQVDAWFERSKVADA